MAEHHAAVGGERYSVREISEIVGMTPRQVRSLVTEDIVHPVRGDRGKYFFSFQDLVLIRGIAHLVGERGVPMSRVRSAVLILREQLPDDTALTEARLDASGGSVVVSLDTTSWEPESGQTVLVLEAVAEAAGEVRDARNRAAPEGESASSWYAYADGIEDSDPIDAEAAYRRAIELDPGFAEAHLNLGRLLHAGGAVRDALEQYELALASDPDDATTHYNIGVAYDDLRDEARAVAAYLRAIEVAPRFADALYNLAAVYERTGDTARAVQHLHAYRDLIEGR